MIICKDCGKKVKRFSGAKFCFECISKHNLEGSRLRYIRKRKGFEKKCIFCGKELEHVHHADMNRKNNNPENLIPLCAKCHKKIHSLIIKPLKRS